MFKKSKVTMISSILAFFCVIAFSIYPQGKAYAAVEDGTYSITYTVLQADSDSASIANDYFQKPATLTVKDGVMTVQLTMTTASSITWLKTTYKGSLSNVTVVSEDKAKDTRVVKFNVDNLSDKLISKMKVDIDDINYHHEYTVRFSFEEGSIKATGTASGSTDTNGTTDTNVTTTDDSTTKTDTNATTTENPETGDKENIALLVILFIISSVYFVRKKQLRS